jgi:hypothetical protein
MQPQGWKHLAKPDVNDLRINPIKRAKFEKKEIYALTALMRSEATPDQQKLAIETLLGPKICDTWGMSFRMDDRLTCIALGAQNVGQTLVHVANVASQGLNADKLSLENIPEPTNEKSK